MKNYPAVKLTVDTGFVKPAVRARRVVLYVENGYKGSSIQQAGHDRKEAPADEKDTTWSEELIEPGILNLL